MGYQDTHILSGSEEIMKSQEFLHCDAANTLSELRTYLEDGNAILSAFYYFKKAPSHFTDRQFLYQFFAKAT